MASFSSESPDHPTLRRPVAILWAGDVLALLLFVVIGRAFHHLTRDWLLNVARIGAPFLIGWLAAAAVVGAYRHDRLSSPLWMMERSVVAWLVGDLIALVLRVYVFGDHVARPFALTTIAFTGLFLLGWRAVYLWWLNR